MNENEVLQIAIQYLTKEGWVVAYQTRTQGGPIGGVDAVLFNSELGEFRLIEAKGGYSNSVGRSDAFVNCLGTLIKRIRFESGYLHIEAKNQFRPPPGFDTYSFREYMQKNAVHRNCEYWLAFPSDMKRTIVETLDPSLAGLLRIFILLVELDGRPERFVWGS